MSLLNNANWELKETIGEGTYGKVHHITDGNQDKALKIIDIPSDPSRTRLLKSAGMSDEEIRSYYKGMAHQLIAHLKTRQEAQLTHMVPLEDISLYNDQTFMVCVTMPLLKSLKYYFNVNTDRSPKAVVDLGIKVGEAIDEFHQANIVFGNLAIDNLFIQEDQCLIGDLSLGQILKSETKEPLSVYAAPEVVREEGFDERADVYSLGMMMYQLLNNDHLPFLDQTLSYDAITSSLEKRAAGMRFAYPANADVALASIIMRAVSATSFTRYESMMAFVNALRDYNETVNPATSATHILLNEAALTDDKEAQIALLKQAQSVNNAASYLDEKLAATYYEQGQYEEAVEAYKAYAIKEPQLASPYISLGLCYDHLNDPKKAARYYETALGKMINDGINRHGDDYMTTALRYAYDVKQSDTLEDALEFYRVHDMFGDEMGALGDVLRFASILKSDPVEDTVEDIEEAKPIEEIEDKVETVEEVIEEPQPEIVESNEDVVEEPQPENIENNEDTVEDIVEENVEPVVEEETIDEDTPVEVEEEEITATPAGKRHFAFDDEEDTTSTQPRGLGAYAAAIAAAASLVEKFDNYDPLANIELPDEKSSADVVDEIINQVKAQKDEDVDQPVLEEDIEETPVEADEPVEEEVLEEPAVEEEPVVEEEVEETPAETDEPVEEEVLEEPAVEEEPVVEENVEETPVEADEPVEEEVAEEPTVEEEPVVEEDIEETPAETDEPVEEDVLEEPAIEEEPVVEEDVDETPEELDETIEEVLEEPTVEKDEEENIEIDNPLFSNDPTLQEEVDDLAKTVQESTKDIVESNDLEEPEQTVKEDEVEEVIDDALIEEVNELKKELNDAIESSDDTVEKVEEAEEEPVIEEAPVEAEDVVEETPAEPQQEDVNEDQLAETEVDQTTLNDELDELDSLFDFGDEDSTKQEDTFVDDIIEEVNDEIDDVVEEIEELTNEAKDEVEEPQPVKEEAPVKQPAEEETVQTNHMFDSLMKAAQGFADGGDYEASGNAIKKALSIKHDDIEAMLKLAEADRLSGKYQEAQYTLKRVIGLTPEDPRAYVQMAHVSSRQNAAAVAIDYYEEALKLMIFDQANADAQLLEDASNNYAYLVSHSSAKRMSSHFQNTLERNGYKREARRLRQLIRRSARIK